MESISLMKVKGFLHVSHALALSCNCRVLKGHDVALNYSINNIHYENSSP